MRIPNFQRLITNEETQTVILKNCDLVVDGLMLFFSSYEKAGLNSTFGIDANTYARYLINEKLQMFKKANVNCHVVFSTAYETFLNKKIHVTHNRNSSTSKYYSTMFIPEVCREVIEEAGSNYSTSVLTGKNDCVASAKKFNCPILSFSPVLCFHHVPYLLLPTLEFIPSKNHITCKLYNFKSFLAKHQLTEKKAAIFAALSDIELFPQFYFDNLFKELVIYHNMAIIQHKRLIKWLSEHTETNILHYITNFLSSQIKINKFNDYVKNVLNDMYNFDQESFVAAYLYGNPKLTVLPQDPFWFEKGAATNQIAKPYIGLFKIKFLQGSRNLDDNNRADSLMLSIDIIKYAYNLLTNYEKNGSFTVLQPAGDPVVINTDDLNIKKPKYKCEVSVFENDWTDIKRLKLFEHFLYENNINVDKVEEVPRDARMFLIALTYFTRRKQSADVSVNKEVYCFIVCYVILEHSTREREHLQKYFQCDEDEAKLIFDADTLRPLEEMYNCLLHMNYLNKLCGAPYKPTIYHKTFNGIFIYKLLLDMVSSQCEPNDFIQDLIGKNSLEMQFINSLFIHYAALKN